MKPNLNRLKRLRKIPVPTNRMTENHAMLILDSILTQWMLMEQLDQLEHTTFYRHQLKMRVKQLLTEIEATLATEVANIYGIDDDAFHNLLQHKKEALRKISTLRPELQSGFNELLSEYLKAPELVMHRNGIQITRR